MSIVFGAGIGPPPSVVALYQAEERRRLDVALLDRQEPASGSGTFANAEWSDAARSGVRAAARRVLRAERGVAADLLAGRLRVPEEVARAG